MWANQVTLESTRQDTRLSVMGTVLGEFLDCQSGYGTMGWGDISFGNVQFERCMSSPRINAKWGAGYVSFTNSKMFRTERHRRLFCALNVLRDTERKITCMRSLQHFLKSHAQTLVIRKDEALDRVYSPCHSSFLISKLQLNTSQDVFCCESVL